MCEGVKVTSCLVLTEAAKRRDLARHLTALRVGEFEVAIRDVESQTVGIERPKTLATANDLISTAQAAELLGYSRPYVAMLIDQNKLKGAIVSAGGHRIMVRSTVSCRRDRRECPIAQS